MKKTILITGSSHGFGKDAALTFAQAGHRVFATMRDIKGRNWEAANELMSKDIEVLELDVRYDDSVTQAFTTMFKRTRHKLDVLINNAGLMYHGVSESITAAQTLEMFDVNVMGIQRTTRAALPAMGQARSGLIINMGSILGRVTIPFAGLYGASKHAVEAMTESYRYELSQVGVDVVLVQPSAFPTNLYSTRFKRDGARDAKYGAAAAYPSVFSDFLRTVFGSARSPNPHDVVVELVKLVDMPAGERPDRVVVGYCFGASDVNAAVRPIQSHLIESIGLTDLVKLRA